MLQKSIGCLLIGGWMVLSMPAVAQAETIYLKDGSSFEGSVAHYYEGGLQVVLASGDTLLLAKDELAKIVFVEGKSLGENKKSGKSATPQGDAAYATPEKTVRGWIKALSKGDIEAMAASFVATTQPLMLQKLKEIDDSQRKKMVKDAKRTDFEFANLRIEGDRASLTLVRTFAKQRSEEELALVLEGGNWKMLPNE